MIETTPSFEQEYLTVHIEDALFGIPVKKVKDVFSSQPIMPVPLASSDILGVMNLRGNIVTAINLRERLSLFEQANPKKGMHVVVEYGDELYSLVIDSVGEVLSLPPETIEAAPSILDPKWREVTSGVYKLKDKLLIILNLDKILKNS
jgi:purine-binding chemotaxis protein CheW